MITMVLESLVGGIPTPLKNMKVSWDVIPFPTYGKIKATFQTTNQIMLNPSSTATTPAAKEQVIGSQVQRGRADGPHSPLRARGKGLLFVGRA